MITVADESDIVTRLLNSDGRIAELFKEAADYIVSLRHAYSLASGSKEVPINGSAWPAVVEISSE